MNDMNLEKLTFRFYVCLPFLVVSLNEDGAELLHVQADESDAGNITEYACVIGRTFWLPYTSLTYRNFS